MDQQRIKRALSSDAFFIGAAVAVILLMGLPRIGMAGLWDEPKVYLKPLFELYEDFFGFFSLPLNQSHRPPGIHFPYLPFLWFFGPHMVVIRILNLVYFCSGIYFFYNVFASEDRFLTRLTLAFALLTPVFQVYSVQYVGEPQLFALISLYLYLLTFHSDRSWMILFLGIFMGLVRETSLALIPAAALMLYLRGERGIKYFFLIGPLIGCAIYWTMTYLKTGSMFAHMTVDQGHISLFREFNLRVWITWQTFLAPYRLIPLIAVSLILFLKYKNWKRPSPLTGFCLVILVAYVFVFSSHLYGIPRYFYAAFPFIVFFFLKPLSGFSKSRGLVIGAICLVLLPPVLIIGNPTQNNEPPFYAFQGYQDSWAHLEIAKIHQEAVAQIKHNNPAGSMIMTSWPFLEIFNLKHGGYGPRINYRLTNDPGNEVPDVILYANYPKSFPDGVLEKMLKRARYRERSFTYIKYHVRLFEKQTVSGEKTRE